MAFAQRRGLFEQQQAACCGYAGMQPIGFGVPRRAKCRYDLLGLLPRPYHRNKI
jgi:hypothetical protein